MACRRPDRDAVPGVGEFPVGGLLGLRIADRLEQDEVVAGVGALAAGRLLPPVRQRVGLGLIRLVDQQEYAAVGRVPDVHVVTIVRDLPAARDPDRETGRIGEPVIAGRQGRGRAGRRRRRSRGRGRRPPGGSICSAPAASRRAAGSLTSRPSITGYNGPAELAVGQLREPPLDEVDPRRAGRG
jgi:hypothetical protein